MYAITIQLTVKNIVLNKDIIDNFEQKTKIKLLFIISNVLYSAMLFRNIRSINQQDYIFSEMLHFMTNKITMQLYIR